MEKVQNLMQSSQNPDLQCQCTRDVSVLTAVEINQDPKLIQEFIVYGVRVDLREKFWREVRSLKPSSPLGRGSDAQVSIARSFGISGSNDEEE